MKINKQELQRALEIVKPGLANKEMIEQTTSFAFLKGKVVTYNDEISISHPIEGIDFEGAIQADELYKLLGKMKKEEIDLSIEGNEVILKAGRAKAGISLQQEIKLPLTDEIKEKSEWEDIPSGFIEAMQFAVGACSSDMSRPVLTCIHVNQSGFIEASDGHRLAKSTFKKEFPTQTFLLPSTSVLQVVKLNPIKISEGNGWIHFLTEEETIISCRILEDAFPPTAHLYKVKGQKFTFPKNTLEVLEKACVFSKRDYVLDESISITIERRKLIIESKSDVGWYEESLNVKGFEEPVSFSITPYLLKDILMKTLACQFNEKMLKFTDENWEYVTTLRGKKEN